MPRILTDVDELVDEIIERTEGHVRAVTPAGLGKPNYILNALVDRAMTGALARLEIYTALSLAKPRSDQDLLARLMGPIATRCFGDYPDPTYVALRARGALPDNIRVHEFYYPPGSMLGNDGAQRDYMSINFTHVARKLWEVDFNVLLQLVAPTPGGYDLSGNTDLAVDLLAGILRRREEGRPAPLVIGQTNRRLPVMGGDAFVSQEAFDVVLEAHDHELFGRPTMPPTDAEYMIGAQAAALLKDGGTIQIGIGNIGDAVAWAALVRHRDPEAFESVLGACGQAGDLLEMIDRVGGRLPFERGLYASTEMLPEGLLRMYEGGVLCRVAVDDIALQRALDRSGATRPSLPLLDALRDAGRIDQVLSPEDVGWLQSFGVLDDEVGCGEEGLVVGGEVVSGSLEDARTREVLARGLGSEIVGAASIHAGFFLGSQAFYASLRGLSERDRGRIQMTSVQFTNKLLGLEELKRTQRRHARFVNEGMKVTLGGAVVSDGLEGGRVVSGVGGQFEFVSMAHELEGARSILVIQATRTSRGRVTSNVVWEYGHTTIPRHLRDIVITEYGVADLRGKTDEEVCQALIEVADARFQEELVGAAKAAGKLRPEYEVPAASRENRPEILEGRVRALRQDGIIPRCPFGTELTDVELDLVEGLVALGDVREDISRGQLPEFDLGDARAVLSPGDAADVYLERMGLVGLGSVQEALMQKLLLLGLSKAGHLEGES